MGHFFDVPLHHLFQDFNQIFKKMKAVFNFQIKIDDKQTEQLSTDIATKIQNEMTYPGQVKITVIRETRSIAYAK